MIKNVGLLREPTPGDEAPPSDSSPVNWKPYSNDKREYIYIQPELTEMRAKLRPMQTSYWNNYLDWMATGGDLHKTWDDIEPEARALPVMQAFKDYFGEFN